MNIGKLLTKSARSFPERLAVVQGENSQTYEQFNGRANKLANALFRLGVRPGDNVTVLMYNCPQMLESIFACLKAGLGSVPINFRLHPREFAFIIEHSESKAVLLSPEFIAPLAEIREGIPADCHLISSADAGRRIPRLRTVAFSRVWAL